MGVGSAQEPREKHQALLSNLPISRTPRPLPLGLSCRWHKGLQKAQGKGVGQAVRTDF